MNLRPFLCTLAVTFTTATPTFADTITASTVHPRSPEDILCDIASVEPGLAMAWVETTETGNQIADDGLFLQGKIPVSSALEMYKDFLKNNNGDFTIENQLVPLFEELIQALSDPSAKIYTCAPPLALS